MSKPLFTPLVKVINNYKYNIFFFLIKSEGVIHIKLIFKLKIMGYLFKFKVEVYRVNLKPVAAQKP